MVDAKGKLDPIDSRLLDAVQQAIPLEPRPFRKLGETIGVSEDEVIARLRELCDGTRVIRQISAIFDTHALGYASSLVAARCDPAHLDDAASIINAHPGVSHNFQRSHQWNLWYTIAVPPDSQLGLDRTMDVLHRISGALATHPLPTLKLYKIGVRFPYEESNFDDSPAYTEADRQAAAEHQITERDKQIIRAAQLHMPIVPEPFAPLAEQAGCSVDELLDALRRFEERRQMRRFSAVLYHRKVGFAANVMMVWRVDDERADDYGQQLAAVDAVSHCYWRRSYPDWPYNLYTMIHARSRDEALTIMDDMKRQIGIDQCEALWSVKEYKKVRVTYFTDAIAEWESAHADA